MLGQSLVGIVQQDKNEHANLPIIISFCKICGEEYAGLQSKRMMDLSSKFGLSLPQSSLIPKEKQQPLRTLLKEYYVTLVKRLKVEHKEVQIAERNKRKQLATKGEISNEKREQLEVLLANYEKLFTSTQSLSDILNEPMPELPVEPDPEADGAIIDVNDDFANLNLDPWGDEETKQFYTQLPDLRGILPNYCPPKEVTPTEDDQAVTEETLDAEELPPLPEEAPEEETPETSNTPDQVEEPPMTAPTAPTMTQLLRKQNFETFLNNLTNCVNKELTDSAAIEFLLNYNNKPNRKKLVRTLFSVHRTRLDLLPMYARLMSVVNLVSPEAAAELCQLLKNDFKYQIAKRDQITIESKIKVTRFIGEMVKFGLYPKLEVLMCLKILLYNFAHHQIEMTCALLEVCGLYLYNSKESRSRTHAYLDKMMRLKTVHALDSRHAAQVENAFYLVRPPDDQGPTIKQRPVMHQYIRHLLFKELDKNNVEMVIRLLRRLNYDDPVIFEYTVRCLSKAYNVRYNMIKHFADVLSGLSSYHLKLVNRVIDNIFEDVRAGLEFYSPKLAQRRVAMITYLGEMYNYRLIEASHALNTLYLVISLGVTMNYEIPSEVDPPGSLFRLKLACTLLNTCGLYFTKSSHRKRLDYFLVFLQNYYWFKKTDPIFEAPDSDHIFPILVDHMYRECLQTLRPKLKLYKSYDEAKEAVEKLRNELYPNLDSTGAGGDADKLGAIEEIESEGEEGTDEQTSEAVGDESDGDADDERKEREMLNEEDEVDPNETELTDFNNQEFVPRKEEKNQDDLEFEQLFEKMAQESYQERLKEIPKTIVKDVPVPVITKSGKKTYEQLQAPEKEVNPSSVPFTLVTRGGKAGKQQLKVFQAPIDSQLAQNLLKEKERIREENERVKRLTLNITERIEEEDYQESLLQNQRSPMQNRFRNYKKFKHQRGAPDADAIFH